MAVFVIGPSPDLINPEGGGEKESAREEKADAAAAGGDEIRLLREVRGVEAAEGRGGIGWFHNG